MGASEVAFVGALLFYGVLMGLTTKKAKDEGDVAAFRNNFACTLVLVGGLLFAKFVGTFQPILAYPLDVVVLMFLGIFVPAFAAWAYWESKNPHYDQYSRPPEGLTMRYEVYRKTTHFVVVGVFLLYFYFGPYFMAKFNEAMALTPQFWGISNFGVPPRAFGQYFVVFWVSISFFGLTTADLVRILRPNAYPLKKVNRILRNDELKDKLGPHIAMSIGVLATVLTIGPYAPKVACAAISIGIFGDAAANLVGKKIGRHSIRESKTWEGLLGGAVVSFVSAMAFLIYEELLTVSATGYAASRAALVAISGTLVFVVVDVLSPSISDNLLNTFVSGIAMAIVTLFIVF
ncbi:MAG: hypothetical protein Kow0069_10860 [Promethearchaeota archaeon]